MSSLVFPATDVPTLAVAGSEDRVPVRRIFCVGRNYAAHAAEMGDEVDREAPFYFTKSAHAVIGSGGRMEYPPRTNDLHHEVELVVVIGEGGKDIAEADALSHVWGYAVGLDMTRRDLQHESKEAKRPWDTSKDFDQAAIIGPATKGDAGITPETRITLTVNGETRQDAPLSELVHPVPALIADLSRLYTLAPGDLIMTGTPAGVGPVIRGDRLEGRVEGLEPVTTTIV